MQMNRRQFAATVGGMGAGLIAPRALAQAAKPADFDITPYVHPDLRQLVKPLLSFARGDITAATLAQAREGNNRFALPTTPQPEWHEQMVPGAKGDPDVRCFVINAGVKDKPRPAILHIHGGGFIVGTAKSALGPMQKVAAELDCMVVTVDYRLAPEVKFPGPLEDNYAGLKWLYANAEKLGVDKTRIAVMGESAGGGHAAMLAIAARNRGEVPLCHQHLIYPMLDDRTGSTAIKPPYMGGLIWTPGSNRFGWSSLLGVPAGSRTVPAGAVPAREVNLKGLPPTFIGVGSIDLFVDEDTEYARRLIDAGVPCELVVVPGGFHGFDMMPTAAVSKRFNANAMAALKAGLGIAG